MCLVDYSFVGNYPAQQVFWTAGRGWGLRALVPIKEVQRKTFFFSSKYKIKILG